MKVHVQKLRSGAILQESGRCEKIVGSPGLEREARARSCGNKWQIEEIEVYS